jgi:hypothetical protein
MALAQFRGKLQQALRKGGYSQKQLAYELGMHPAQLSNKLNEHNHAHLSSPEIKQIVKILAQWQVITSQAQAIELLALLHLNYQSFSPQEWLWWLLWLSNNLVTTSTAYRCSK